FTYRITIEGLEGHHGEGSDAQQQRKEEAEAGQEQEERCRSVRHAQPGQTRHLVHEPIRQEALAGDHVLVPLGRDPYCARSTLETEMPTGTVKWFNPTKGYGFIQPSGGGGKDVLSTSRLLSGLACVRSTRDKPSSTRFRASAAKSLRPILGSSSGIGVFGLGRCKTNTQKVAILLMWP